MGARALIHRRVRMPAPHVVKAGVASAALVGVAVTFAGAAPNRAPLAGRTLYAPADASIERQVASYRRQRPGEGELLARVASQPAAQWLGEWSGDVRAAADRLTSAAAKTGALPVLVAYNIPNRDCGSYSAGGTRNAGAYRKWIGALAQGIGSRAAVVVLEPDALASTSCLSGGALQERYDLLREAVRTLKSNPRTTVYVDAGHARWLKPAEAAARLRQAGGEQADGFALNVSNFIATDESVAYGDRVSSALGGKHYVIDTSRNGRGAAANNEWCNPSGRALGHAPTTSTGYARVDALLWIKRPGESDGTCNGGPRAGQFWPEYAIGLAQRAPQQLALR